MISKYLRSECCDAPVEDMIAWQDLSQWIQCTGCWGPLAVTLFEDWWETVGRIEGDTL